MFTIMNLNIPLLHCHHPCILVLEMHQPLYTHHQNHHHALHRHKPQHPPSSLFSPVLPGSGGALAIKPSPRSTRDLYPRLLFLQSAITMIKTCKKTYSHQPFSWPGHIDNHSDCPTSIMAPASVLSVVPLPSFHMNSGSDLSLKGQTVWNEGPSYHMPPSGYLSNKCIGGLSSHKAHLGFTSQKWYRWSACYGSRVEI